MDRRRDNAVERVSGLDPAELSSMQKLQSRTETRLLGGQSVTGSPRQGANMVTDPVKNIVTNPAGRLLACEPSC
jgi:hypothetical protein